MSPTKICSKLNNIYIKLVDGTRIDIDIVDYEKVRGALIRDFKFCEIIKMNETRIIMLDKIIEIVKE